MNILGIHGDYFNPKRTVFESNAAVVVDGRVVSAVAEERVSREKLDGRFPWGAVHESMRVAGVANTDLDYVVFSTRSPVENAIAYFKCTATTLLDTSHLVANESKTRSHAAGLVARLLKRGAGGFYLNGRAPARQFPIQFIDHHYAHAAGAFFGSPYDEALIITLDGGGNGLDGGAYAALGNRVERFLEIPHFQSPGTMYSAITYDLGFKRHRHEGKITGLAAYGTPNAKAMGLDDLIVYDRKKHRFIAPEIAAHHRNLNSPSTYFTPVLENFSREDVAATVQQLFEDVILEFIADAAAVARERGHAFRNVCLAGGCFANVKLNQRIREMGLFDDVFVYPAMSDGGLGAGAAQLFYYDHVAGAERAEASLSDVYLGSAYSEREMEEALRSRGLAFERCDAIEEDVAGLLADGLVVARFNGAMEYGPRALGNRSILAAPFDATINDWLNEKLRRTEFMPFAPSITQPRAADYLEGYSQKHVAAEYMTITYDMKPGVRERIPAVVHVDNTARPQIVKESVNPSYFRIIDAFARRTGEAVVLNTSFNVHEEPIVRTPDDAINGFLGARLDYLAMGPFLVPLPEEASVHVSTTSRRRRSAVGSTT